MRRLVLALGLLLSAQAAEADATRGLPVDLELVLALDASASMDAEERAIERAGFAAAFRDPAVLRAIRSGPLGRIGVACFAWGGDTEQRVLVAWTLIDGPAAAAAVASAIDGARIVRMRRGTAFGGALRFAGALLAASPFEGRRAVVNITSDGIQNVGSALAPARAGLIEAGVTINGMPILDGLGTAGSAGRQAWNATLLGFFEGSVIGGPAAFIEPAGGAEDLVAAVRRKLLREIGEPALVAEGPGRWSRR